MLSHRNQSAHALYLFSIDAGGDEPYGIGSTRDRVTPGIADKRAELSLEAQTRVRNESDVERTNDFSPQATVAEPRGKKWRGAA